MRGSIILSVMISLIRILQAHDHDIIGQAVILSFCDDITILWYQRSNHSANDDASYSWWNLKCNKGISEVKLQNDIKLWLLSPTALFSFWQYLAGAMWLWTVALYVLIAWNHAILTDMRQQDTMRQQDIVDTVWNLITHFQPNVLYAYRDSEHSKHSCPLFQSLKLL